MMNAPSAHSRSKIRRPVLLIGGFLTLTLGLSAHVLMMTVLNVPYPSGSPATGILRFLNEVAIALAVLLIYQFADPRRWPRNMLTRAALLFLLVTMMAERLLRGALMNGFVTTAWGYSFIQTVPTLAPWAALAGLVAGLAPLASSWPRRVLAALIFAALSYLVVAPLADHLYAPILKAAAPLNHDAVYGFPYGWQVTTAAYITYVEPVAACLACAALVWPRLPGRAGLKIAELTLLIFLVRGSLLAPFAYAAANREHWLAAFVSDGQFAFESLVLGLLTALTWWAATTPTALAIGRGKGSAAIVAVDRDVAVGEVAGPHGEGA